MLRSMQPIEVRPVIGYNYTLSIGLYSESHHHHNGICCYLSTSVCLFVCLVVCLSVCMSDCLAKLCAWFVWLSSVFSNRPYYVSTFPLSVYLPASLFAYLSVRPSVRLPYFLSSCLYLSVYLLLVNLCRAFVCELADHEMNAALLMASTSARLVEENR